MKRLEHARWSVLGLVVVLLVTAAPGLAQLPVDADPGSSVRTRADLEALLAGYEQVLGSPAYSGAVKNDVRVRAERVRDRLMNGDFKLGDRVVLFVQNEPNLPDTVAVQSSPNGPKISLPLFGDIALAGVLRSEIEDRLREALSQFIRDPVLRAEGLMRISVQGAVRAPGFYLVPANVLLSETLMVAGGPAPDSDLTRMRIERGSEELFSGQALQEELRQGRTLDQLNLQAGDQLVLPVVRQGGFLRSVPMLLGLASSLSLLIFQLAR